MRTIFTLDIINKHNIYHKNLNRERHPVSPLTNTAAQQDVFPALLTARQV